MTNNKLIKRQAYIHATTDNNSFLATYLELKKLGVENCNFFLKIYDKSLMYVDPHDPDLDDITKGKILQEIKINPWYFFRQVVMVPTPGGSTRFRLHRGNLALIWCLLNSLNAILILPRQNYKTISACCFYLYQYDFGTSNSTFIFSNKEYKDSKLNLKRLNDIRKLLPEWMVIIDKVKDKDNIEEIYSAETKNTITAIPSAIDPAKADKLGRGMTSPNLWFDEKAFLKFNKEIYMSASPAFSQAKIEAQLNNKCYGKLITTTPSNTDTPHGKFCKEMINKAADFIDQLYDMTRDQVQEYIKKNSKNSDFLYIFYNYKELRRTEAWFEEQCINLNGDIKMIRREILCEWTSSSDTCPFNEEQILKLEGFETEPISSITLQHFFKMDVYKEFDESLSYPITVDVAGGLMRDRSVIIVNDPFSIETVGLMKSNNISIPELRRAIKEVSKILPKSFFIIERNSYGLSIIKDLLEDKDLKKRIFFTEKKEKGKKTKRTYGIDTNTATRPLIIECIKLMVVDTPEVIGSNDIITEIKTLERKKGGKIEHSSGEHDDCVMAKGFAKYVFEYSGDTLKKFIKLNASSIAKSMRRISDANSSKEMNRTSVLLSELRKDGLQKAKTRVFGRKKPSSMEKISSLNNKDFSQKDLKRDFANTRGTVSSGGLDWFKEYKEKKLL